jgi:tRNA nucleotidyltransferase/poly(A) polymerase
MNFSREILSDPVNKWVFRSTDREIYLVGGYLRDLLRGFHSRDKDYAVRDDAERVAKMTANHFKGTFITLKAGKTFRVVLKGKGRGRPGERGDVQAVLDFSSLNTTIYKDLESRDYTINAMAWSPEKGIIDLFHGGNDLKKQIIRAVKMKNLLKDPLRIVRAYRLAAEIGCGIDKETRVNLRLYSKKIKKAAPERITEELFQLLNNDNAGGLLDKCCRDGVIQNILINNGAKKTDYIGRVKKNIKYIALLDTMIDKIKRKKQRNMEEENLLIFLCKEISQGLSRSGILRLLLLTRYLPSNFSGLRTSRIVQKTMRDMDRGLKGTTFEDLKKIKRISKSGLFEIFNNSNDRAYEMAVIISIIRNGQIKNIMMNVEEYMRIKKKVLLNGEDVKKILNIKQGLKVGKVLGALRAMQMKGLIKNRREASRWIVSNFT